MINFIVCDDEKQIIELVKNIISKIMFKTNLEYKVHKFTDYDKKFNDIIKSDLENKIYILDIEVGKYSGLDVAKKIRNTDWNSVILILTAHSELEYLAFKSKLLLFDFISKFDLYENQIFDTITLCVEKVISNDKLIIKVDRKYEQIAYDNILYLTYDSYSRKLKIITKSGEYETNASLKETKEKLKGNFIYTHRDCVVNLKNVKTFDLINRKIIFKNGIETYLLSKRYVKEVKEYANS